MLCFFALEIKTRVKREEKKTFFYFFSLLLLGLDGLLRLLSPFLLLLLLGADHSTSSRSSPDLDATGTRRGLLLDLFRHEDVQHAVLDVGLDVLHDRRRREAHRARLERRRALRAVVARVGVPLLAPVLLLDLDRHDVVVDGEVDAGVLDARDVGEDLELLVGFCFC